MNTPPVVDKYVENTEQGNKERSAPFRLEPNSDHDTSAETDDRDEDSGKRPAALEDESDEKKDEEDTPGKLEAEG